MKTKSISLEVLTLFFLTFIPWPGPTVFKISCSRDSAKIVRKIVQSKWIPILEKHQVKLPLECPFHPLRDIFGPQHAAKFQHRSSQWTCGFCGKSFYEEKYLDMHFDNRHKSKINKAEDAVCLSDYCDIMRCQVLISQDSTLATGDSGIPSTDIEIWREATVYRTALIPSGSRELAVVFLDGNGHEVSQKKKFQYAVEHQNCPKNSDPDSHKTDGDGKADENDGEVNNTSELCDKDLVDSALPPVDHKQQKIAELQKLKANCNPEELQVLKTRCEVLVRDCIASLLIHLSVQEFKEVEEEMNRAVCWFLSCDRYWEDATQTVRPFPWPLVISITTVLTLAICMCYYIIWVLFDSDDRSLASTSATVTAHSSPARLVYAGPGGAQDDTCSSENIGADQCLSDHYIYVTYPPELKRRLLESCYNRTTRL